MSVECFLIEPTDEVVPILIVIEDGDCPDRYGHRATYEYPREPLAEHERDERGLVRTDNMPSLDAPEYAQVTNCERCGYEFTDKAKRSATVRRVWRSQSGEEHSRPHDFGPGAMWNAYWMPHTRAPDGRCLVVITPSGHEWMIDGSANNCTRPGEPHQCWVREGEPPKVTITKGKPGESCGAGAGSIATPGYHGFLRDGRFT